MNRYRDYIFGCLLVIGGILFVAYEGAQGAFDREIKEGQPQAVEQVLTEVSDNAVLSDGNDGEDASVSENDLETAVEDQEASPSGGAVSGNDGTSNGNGGTASVEWSYGTVDESYFDDAVFIGDSRTVGLYDYGGLDRATFYASSGLTVYKLFEDPDGKFKDGNWKENIETALKRQQFGKVYLMVGINEMGTGDVDYFIKHYGEAVERIRQLQPDAIIYLESIMRVTAERSAQGDYINNQGIDERNRRIAELADNQKIFYLDVNSVVCDETGGLNPEYTFDGVHLYAQYIDIWKQYLMEHAIQFNP